MSYFGCTLGSDCSCDASESSWCVNRGYGKEREKLRPCDCKDAVDTGKLQEQGIFHNDEGIMVVPNYVLLKIGHTEVKIGMKRFKMMAEWYLEPQEIKEK